MPIPAYLQPIADAEQLLLVLDRLGKEVESGAWRPLVHIEVHGNKEGCRTRHGDFVPWDRLTAPLRRINVAMRNSLIVTIAACKGLYIASGVANHPLERAPFCGAIGPDATVSSDALLDGFTTFFTELVQRQDFAAALHEVRRKHLPEACAFDSADLFIRAAQRYVTVETNGERLKDRITGLGKAYVRSGAHARSGTKLSRRARARLIREKESNLERYWEQFIMADLYPENDARFGALTERVRSSF